MTYTPRLLLLREVAALFCVSPITIYRWVAKERRERRGFFILPISEEGRLRFLASDVESFLQSRSTASQTVNAINTTAQRKEAKVVNQQRDAAIAAARATLERHRNRIGRKTK